MMGPIGNAILGFVFFVVGAAATLLMYHLWGYPFDHKTMRSEAPRRSMILHRILGYGFLVIYVYLMVQMLPRLWGYQIELPSRTVAHLTIGMLVGAALILKVVVVRFFKHLESTLAPSLGTLVMISTIILIGLAAPMALRESFATTEDTFAEDNLDRVRAGLALAGLEDAGSLGFLASAHGLRAGRQVLSDRCVACHDLRTVLIRPRTPGNWRETVRRMAGRSTILSPITEQEQWRVTAYLIAISPELQASAGERRREQEQQASTQTAVSGLSLTAESPFDHQKAQELFEARCSQCHPATMIDARPPSSVEDVHALVSRMTSNGLSANEEELNLIARYLTERFTR